MLVATSGGGGAEFEVLGSGYSVIPQKLLLPFVECVGETVKFVAARGAGSGGRQKHIWVLGMD